MTMNEPHEPSDDTPRQGDDVKMVDLGDAKVETTQYNPFPVRFDSAMQAGWG
jgi:hypothetical protein